MLPPGLSRRQRTFAELFPRFERPIKRRPKRPHQLGLGEGFVRVGRCPSCAHELHGRTDCTECGAFTCARCDAFTSVNGGDGTCCARCA
jgi:hypothetical protein